MPIILILIYLVLLSLLTVLFNMSLKQRISWSWPVTINPILIIAAFVVAWYYSTLPDMNYSTEITISKWAGFVYLAFWGIIVLSAAISTLVDKFKQSRIEKKYVAETKQKKQKKSSFKEYQSVPDSSFREFKVKERRESDGLFNGLIIASIVFLLVGGAFNLRQGLNNRHYMKVRATYLGVTEYTGPEICGVPMEYMPTQEVVLKPLFGYDIGQDKYLARGEELTKSMEKLKVGDKTNIFVDKEDPSIIGTPMHFEVVFIPCYIIGVVLILVLLNYKGIIDIKKIAKDVSNLASKAKKKN